MGNSVLLIGNGFLYSIADFLEKNRKDNSNKEIDEVSKRIKLISGLWKEFDDIHKDRELSRKLADIYNVRSLSPENFIEHIYSSMDILRLTHKLFNDGGIKKCESCFSDLSKSINNAISSKIASIIDKFWNEEEENKLYPTLYNFRLNGVLVKDKNIEGFLNNISSIYTTNYDGVLEILFKFNENRKGKIFNLVDLFNSASCGIHKNDGENENKDNYQHYYVCFSGINYYRNAKKLLHLHGSYKFFKYTVGLGELEIKIKKEKKQEFFESLRKEIKDKSLENGSPIFSVLFPIIVFGAPNLKMEVINSYNSLRTYFVLFQQDLKRNKNLIIWGQSLKNDPHILNAIKEFFIKENPNGNKKIIIIDVDENHILRSNDNSNVEVEFINPSQFQNMDKLLQEITNKIYKI